MDWRAERPDFLAIHEGHEYVTGRPFPRLHFSAEELPAIRAKAAECPELLKATRAEADDLLGEGSILGLDTTPSISTGQKMAEALSVAFVLTGEEAYAQKCKDVLAEVMQLDTWVYPVHQPTEFDHGAANVTGQVALAFDRIASVYSAEEQAELIGQLVARGVDVFRRVYANRSEGWTRSDFNWRPMCCSDSGLGVLAVMDAYPQFREALRYAIDGCLAILDDAPRDGEWAEGFGYWGAAIGRPLRFAAALYRASDGAVNLFAHPYLKATADFLLHCSLPDGSCFDFADCGPAGVQANPTTALLAARTGSRQLQWLARAGEGTTYYHLLWHDAALPAEEPAKAEASKHFREYDLVTCRSGWRDDDTFVGFRSGPTAYGHSHLDTNSFVIFSHGKWLARDLGTWPYAHYLGFFDSADHRWDFDANATVGHNSILVDGLGQSCGPECRGEVAAFESTDDCDWLVSDAAATYPGLLTKFTRWLVFLKPDVIVVLDELASEQARRFEWLLHYEGAIAGDGATARVTNDDVCLDVAFVLPTQDEGWVCSDVARRAYYTASNTGEPAAVRNRYRSFHPLHRAKEQRFLTVMRVYPASEEIATGGVASKVESLGDQLRLTLEAPAGPRMICFDLAERRVIL